ncbi:hypothetical protein SprV_0100408300 [Sparganum proliferum]
MRHDIFILEDKTLHVVLQLPDPSLQHLPVLFNLSNLGKNNKVISSVSRPLYQMIDLSSVQLNYLKQLYFLLRTASSVSRITDNHHNFNFEDTDDSRSVAKPPMDYCSSTIQRKEEESRRVDNRQRVEEEEEEEEEEEDEGKENGSICSGVNETIQTEI